MFPGFGVRGALARSNPSPLLRRLPAQPRPSRRKRGEGRSRPMPLQNRVTPSGDIIATPHRGMFTGNRGIIHDPATKTADAPLGEQGVAHLRLRIQGTAAQGDGRPQLDRAVLSRRGDGAWRRVTARASSAAATTPTGFAPRGKRATALRMFSRASIDAVLHRERLEGRAKRLHPLPAPVERLPDGAMVQARQARVI